jgi:hypothetical protein
MPDLSRSRAGVGGQGLIDKAAQRPELPAVTHPRRTPPRIVFWIEHTYKRSCRPRGLGKLTPVEFELAFATDSRNQT